MPQDRFVTQTSLARPVGVVVLRDDITAERVSRSFRPKLQRLTFSDRRRIKTLCRLGKETEKRGLTEFVVLSFVSEVVVLLVADLTPKRIV
jgi:hypothetical protein